MEPKLETLVIGAGPTGLAIAACLRERGTPFVIAPILITRTDDHVPGAVRAAFPTRAALRRARGQRQAFRQRMGYDDYKSGRGAGTGAACAASWLHIKYLDVKIQSPDTDSIDRIRAQWKVARPDLDTRPMEIVGRILRIEFIAGARIRRVLQRHGIDWGGFDVLATLRRSGAPYRMTPTNLYKELVLSSGAMTNRLDVLERAGLVQRHPDPNDRRGTLIELTKEGKAVLDRALEAHLQGEAQMVAHLPKEEQKCLADLLKKVVVEMESENEGT